MWVRRAYNGCYVKLALSHSEFKCNMKCWNDMIKNSQLNRISVYHLKVMLGVLTFQNIIVFCISSIPEVCFSLGVLINQQVLRLKGWLSALLRTIHCKALNNSTSATLMRELSLHFCHLCLAVIICSLTVLTILLFF